MAPTTGTPLGSSPGGDDAGAAAWRVPLVDGLRHLVSGDEHAAFVALELAHRLGPDVPEVCLAFGRELARRGDDGALPLLERAHEAEPPLLSATCELIRFHVMRGELDRAEPLARIACHRFPGDPLAWVSRADVVLHRGDLDRAAELAERARQLATTNEDVTAERAARSIQARLHNERGLAAAGDGHLEPALFSFKRARDLDPDWSAPITNMGAALARLGRHERALELYREAEALALDDALPPYNIAIELVALDRLSDARPYLERAISILETSDERRPELLARAQLTLARVHRELGHDARAVRALESASHQMGAGAEIWAELARAHVRCGELGKARRAARIALALCPDSTAVRTAWLDVAALRARRRRRSVPPAP